jgi:hypothetical protein
MYSLEKQPIVMLKATVIEWNWRSGGRDIENYRDHDKFVRTGPTPVKSKMFLIVYVVIVHGLKHSNDYDFMKWILLNEFSIQICC